MRFGKHFRFWKNPLGSFHFYNHVVVLVLLGAVSVGNHFSKSLTVRANLPAARGEAIVIVEEPKKSPAPVSAAVLVASPKPKVQGASDAKVQTPMPSASLTPASTARSSSNPLCKSITQEWKMIPDPNHTGQYIICNTRVEKMAIVGELNSEQNKYRQDHNLSAVNINSGLCKIAANRAVEVSKNFSHDGFQVAVDSSGLNFHSYGENIASGPLSAVHFVEWSWDRSPGHRANMLGDWSDGCGGVADKYAVFLFAK